MSSKKYLSSSLAFLKDTKLRNYSATLSPKYSPRYSYGIIFIISVFSICLNILYAFSIDRDIADGLRPYYNLDLKADSKKPQDFNELEKTDNTKSKEIKISIYPKEVEIPHDFTLLNNNCQNRTFSISKSDDINIKKILFELGRECNFSVEYYKDIGDIKADKKEYEDFIDFKYSGAIFFKDEKIDFIIQNILSSFFYEISHNKLKVFQRQLRVFDINYISGTRLSQSNTDVLFSQDQNINNYSNNSSYLYNPSNTDYPSPKDSKIYKNHLDNLNKNASRLKDRLNSTNDTFGKSGTKIYSIDEVNFWDDLQQEIGLILHKNDKLLIDKSAGLIGVWSNKTSMKEVSLFLEKLYSKMSAQVFLDVEIIDLMYFDTTNIGLNWAGLFNIVNLGSLNTNLGIGNISNPPNNAINSGLNYSLNIISKDLPINSIIDFLQTYGDIKSLSNPKISALNNQSAMISVGSVIRYSLNTTFQTSNTTNIIQNTSTQFPSVFVGILLDITPSIDKENIILRINPSITKLKNENLENQDIALSTPPNLTTNQLSSIVKLKDGQRVIIGGLVSNYNAIEKEKIPFLGAIPFIGGLFTHKVEKIKNKELIIIITPRIIR